MATPKHIIEVVYGVFADNNLSRILPVLDEKIVLYTAEYGPDGREYHGRSGFLTMMSRLYKICENISVKSLVYFMSDTDHPPDTIITSGFFEGKLLIDNELAILPFIHYWQVKDDRIVELRAFNWNSAELRNRLQQANKGPNLPSNGHHSGSNGNGTE